MPPKRAGMALAKGVAAAPTIGAREDQPGARATRDRFLAGATTMSFSKNRFAGVTLFSIATIASLLPLATTGCGEGPMSTAEAERVTSDQSALIGLGNLGGTPNV